MITYLLYYYRRDNMESTRNNQSISRRIKLGQDKLFIANKLDTFRREKKLNGYIKTIIVRNTIGTIVCPSYLKSSQYRISIRGYFKQYNGAKMIMDNINIKMIFELLGVGVRIIISKGD